LASAARRDAHVLTNVSMLARVTVTVPPGLRRRGLGVAGGWEWGGAVVVVEVEVGVGQYGCVQRPPQSTPQIG